MEWKHWIDEILPPGVCSIDTETCVVDDPVVTPPELVLASATSDGETAYIIRREDLANFLLLHKYREYVGQNIAGFDFWVIEKWLSGPHSAALDEWWRMFSEPCRVHDTLLLDRLIATAKGEGEAGGKGIPARNLAKICEDYAPHLVSIVDKESPYRLKFSELLQPSLFPPEEGFFEYAAIDAIATWHCYKAMKEVALQLVTPHLQKFHPGAIEKWGILTEDIQVKATIALSAMTRLGIQVDKEKALPMEAELRKEVLSHYDWLRENYPEIFKFKKDGTVELTKSGKVPALRWKVIQDILRSLSEEKGFDLPISEGKTKAISKCESDWKPLLDVHPFIEHWIGPQTKKKLLEFYAIFGKSEKGRLHPRYDVLKKTGRTSVTSSRLQQIPRNQQFRSLFIPAPGYKLMTIDYASIELRTLSATCEVVNGWSVMGSVIRTGKDLHCYTASLILGCPYEEVVEGVASEKKQKKVGLNGPFYYSEARQASKACNFGIPGGLGAPKLSRYAKDNYGVDMTEEEARSFREKIIYEIYPELSDKDGYLSSTYVEDVASSLGISEQLVRGAVSQIFPKRNVDRLLYMVGRVLRHLPFYKAGEKFDEESILKCEEVLHNLFTLARRDDLWCKYLDLKIENDEEKKIKGGSALLLSVFGRIAFTITGRLRGRTDYTNSRNMSFQALAADGMKLALFELVRSGYRVVGQLHDEILIELPEVSVVKEAKNVEKVLVDSMKSVLVVDLPVECEYGVGTCWTK